MKYMQLLLIAGLLAAPACDDAGDTDAIADTVASDTGAVDTTTPVDTDTPADTDTPVDTAEQTDSDDPDGTDDTSGPADADAAEVDTTPVIDPNGDTDGDGIMDLEEVDDGTDPFDPRDARAWHPEIVGHPRLFMAPDAVATVAARVALTEGAHATIWPRVTSRAGQTPPEQRTDGTYDPTIAVARGEIAEAAAFVGLLTGDADMTAKAAAILAAPMPDPTYLNGQSAYTVGEHYNLVESEALVAHCIAYDWLAGTADADPEAVAAARAELVRRVDFFRAICLGPGGCRTLIRNEKNNHTMKPMGALGLCAMAVPDRPTAAADFNEAVASLHWLFSERQGVAEGGYGESWNYLLYGGQSFVQLMYAVHRVAPGRTWRLRGLGTVVPDDPRGGLLTDYPDFADDPVVRGVFTGMLMASTPDGRTAPIDDANPASPFAGFLAALLDDPRFLWFWQLPRVNYATPRTSTATFAALDPAMAPAPPDWELDVFLPEAGYSVLRSDWTPEQLYLHVNHERGRVRTSGYSHEQADNLSFMLHAYGEPLLIDPGYISFSEHLKVKYGTDHNLVLVDGMGPPYFVLDPLIESHPTADAWLHDHDTADGATTLITSTKYHEAELRRRFVRVDQRYVVVADALIDYREAPDAPRTWTWQVNGLAGGTVPNATFTATDLGGTWSRTKARVQVAAVPTIGSATWDETLEDSLTSDGLRTHVRRAASAEMGDAAGFLAVAVPTRAEDAEVTFTALDPAPGVAAIAIVDDAGDVEVLALNLTNAPVTIDLEGTSWSAPVGLTRYVPASGATRTWTMTTPPIPEPEPWDFPAE